MTEAVPVSAFVAVCATLLRFILNFNQKHPNNSARLTINYEIVMLAMPAVFWGSLVGVKIGILIGPDYQTIVFGITVAWSIYTSGKKAIALYKKEKRRAEEKAIDEALLDKDVKGLSLAYLPESVFVEHGGP
jgi:uncharacterized membrane protein YfcA